MKSPLTWLDMVFDIVIPVGPNDTDGVRTSVEYTKRNVIGYRNIYIVSKSDLALPGCIFIDESTFPFTLDSVANILQNTKRAGWYFQQLLKLTAGFTIPDITEQYLVLDADVYILKPTEFIKDGVPLYACGAEYHIPYFKHMARLHPSLTKQLQDPTRPTSGVCHHMVMDRRYIRELFNLVEGHTGMPFVEAFLRHVEPADVAGSGASEYELYFNYVLRYHRDAIRLRQLKWIDTSSLAKAKPDHDFAAIHHWCRV